MKIQLHLHLFVNKIKEIKIILLIFYRALHVTHTFVVNPTFLLQLVRLRSLELRSVY